MLIRHGVTDRRKDASPKKSLTVYAIKKTVPPAMNMIFFYI